MNLLWRGLKEVEFPVRGSQLLPDEVNDISNFFFSPERPLEDISVRKLDSDLCPGMMGLLHHFFELNRAFIAELRVLLVICHKLHSCGYVIFIGDVVLGTNSDTVCWLG